MTAYVDPELIDVLRARAESEPCTCVHTAISGPDDYQADYCLRCLLLGLQPTVTAYEPTL